MNYRYFLSLDPNTIIRRHSDLSGMEMRLYHDKNDEWRPSQLDIKYIEAMIRCGSMKDATKELEVLDEIKDILS